MGLRNIYTKVNFLLVAAIAMLCLTQCSSEKQYKILSFFFDGVPEPNKTTEVVIKDTTSTDSAKHFVIVQNNIPKSGASIHRPYEEEKCKSCHAGDFSNALIKPQPLLCYTCHESFEEKYRSLHGPVASGNCTACHEQHESKYSRLLKRQGQDVCFYCHEPQQVFKNKKHEKINDEMCTECHNPHGGENRGMLVKGTCYDCHDNFNAKYNFVHGPVASENCTSCHDAHSSTTPKHLLRESQQICLYCHDANLLVKNPAHKNMLNKNCTECHNPHGGETRNILVESIMPLKTKPTVEISRKKRYTEDSPVIIKQDSATAKPVIQKGDNEPEIMKSKGKTDSSQVNERKILPVKDSTVAKPIVPVETKPNDVKKESILPDTTKNGQRVNGSVKDSASVKPVKSSDQKDVEPKKVNENPDSPKDGKTIKQYEKIVNETPVNDSKVTKKEDKETVVKQILYPINPKKIKKKKAK